MYECYKHSSCLRTFREDFGAILYVENALILGHKGACEFIHQTHTPSDKTADEIYEFLGATTKHPRTA